MRVALSDFRGPFAEFTLSLAKGSGLGSPDRGNSVWDIVPLLLDGACRFRLTNAAKLITIRSRVARAGPFSSSYGLGVKTIVYRGSNGSRMSAVRRTAPICSPAREGRASIRPN
jgi:hypothetical protein